MYFLRRFLYDEHWIHPPYLSSAVATNVSWISCTVYQPHLSYLFVAFVDSSSLICYDGCRLAERLCTLCVRLYAGFISPMYGPVVVVGWGLCSYSYLHARARAPAEAAWCSFCL